MSSDLRLWSCDKCGYEFCTACRQVELCSLEGCQKQLCSCCGAKVRCFLWCSRMFFVVCISRWLRVCLQVSMLANSFSCRASARDAKSWRPSIARPSRRRVRALRSVALLLRLPPQLLLRPRAAKDRRRTVGRARVPAGGGKVVLCRQRTSARRVFDLMARCVSSWLCGATSCRVRFSSYSHALRRSSIGNQCPSDDNFSIKTQGCHASGGTEDVSIWCLLFVLICLGALFHEVFVLIRQVDYMLFMCFI